MPEQQTKQQETKQQETKQNKISNVEEIQKTEQQTNPQKETKTLEQEINAELDKRVLAKEIVDTREALKSLNEKVELITKQLGQQRSNDTDIAKTGAVNSNAENQEKTKTKTWAEIYELNKMN